MPKQVVYVGSEMETHELPRAQLEGFYAVCFWVTQNLEQLINVVSYMKKTQRIYVQFGYQSQRRAFYIRPDGTSSPHWND